jgi:ribosome-binding protein aMBF1 (putative translation factor)
LKGDGMENYQVILKRKREALGLSRHKLAEQLDSKVFPDEVSP